ncbi:hypothetical protein GBA52_022287 [Prunus armeniaca]|nr:hypothetical protein GBA52_022287 [Prunus armeniaca]
MINARKQRFCYKSPYLGGQREKFVRLDDLDSRLSSPSDSGARRCGFNIEGLSRTGPARDTSFKRGMRKGSEGLKSIGRSLGFGISRAVFPEDLKGSKGSDVLATKQALLFIVLLQYIPRLVRVLPLTSELKRTAGVFAETAWAGAACYLLLYMLASHIVGAFWYLLALERNDTCWQKACTDFGKKCDKNFLYCGNQNILDTGTWSDVTGNIQSKCSPDDQNTYFDFGIYKSALSSGVVSSKKFLPKYCYCLWWGLQNLSMPTYSNTPFTN